ncbi:LPS export ABC transporter permease LptF [Rhodobacteraceae bacterium CCMM004]|nr:LPS export ABC transporter permease LptF [Rhodobacteraceae bacterium CCMM004]
MGRFDRYMLSQLTVFFGFFSLVLVMVYWINRAVSLFDRLIANGHSAGVFLEFTALALPNVIRLVLPISAFAAAVYVTNRLSQESELTVVQATGFSPWRLARPVAVFGILVAVLISLLTHVLVPASLRSLAERSAALSEDITAGLLNEGAFLHPGDGITFYIRDISVQGELRDIFLSDARDPTRETIYTATRAILLKTERGPQLVMFDGMVQSLRGEAQRLETTRFEDFAFDIASLFDLPTAGPRRMSEVSTGELLFPTAALIEETGAPRSLLLVEGHERFTQAMVALVTPLVGFSILMLGGFSRFGIWRQILGAILCLIVIELLDNTLLDLARRDDSLWPLAYVPVAAGLGLAAAFLALAARPRLGRRRAAA